MDLGAFSVSLVVKNLKSSKTFYEKLGFKVFHGEESQNWLIMKNKSTVIGLFEGMFEKNILTFNPGWNENAESIESFDDVRTIQEDLREKGIEFVTKVQEESSGPGSFMIQDPDGNTILIDQHV